MKWENNHTYVLDMVEVETNSRDYFQDTFNWLDSINAKIKEQNHNSITAKHVASTPSADTLPDWFWHKIIHIKFNNNEEKRSISIEISPASDYKDHVFDPYVHWRELVLDYYVFIGVQIDNKHKSRLFDIEYLRLLANQRANARRQVFILTISILVLSVFLLAKGMHNCYFLSLTGLLFIGAGLSGEHLSYLEAIQYLNRIEDQIT